MVAPRPTSTLASPAAPRPRSKSRSYIGASAELRRELGQCLPQKELRHLHQKSATRHFLIVVRQFLLLFGCGIVTWRFSQPWIWIPAAILEGFTLFNFTVLLHEHVHEAIFSRRRPRAMSWLGVLYALPSGISASQFTRWHLDHHDNLGSDTEDPKRAHLSPKRNTRWTKLLYMTPALFSIYFRAARIETASYEPELRRRIAVERKLTIAFHLVAAAALGVLGGWGVLARVYLVPYLLVFPVAFTLNRLGQHYRIDPADPRHWSTRVDGNVIWHFLFLYSNFHLEHHYFPRVPFYHLAGLNRLLRPYFEEHGIASHGYAEILKDWIVHNRPPHQNWG
jgi:fatty acid desaturase